MGFVEFSTESADFIFDGVNHVLAQRDESLFSGLDALVVEPIFALDFVPEGLTERFWFGSFFGNKRLLQQLKKEGIPIFSVDVRTNDTDEGYFFDVPSLKYYWYGLLYEFSKRRIPDNVQKYMSDLRHKEQKANISGRSAISAEKISNHLVERIKREKNISGRRVRMGLIYGLSHIDIVDYLKLEERRTEALSHHQRLGFNGLIVEDLGIVVKYEYTPHDSNYNLAGWTAKRENSGLFRNGKLKRVTIG